MLAELMIGRAGAGHAIRIPSRIASKNNSSSLWGVIGGLGLFTSMLMFSFYSVVASWILFYLMKSLSGGYNNIPAEIVQNEFGALLANPTQMFLWHMVYVLIVISVLAVGMERAARTVTRFLTLALLGLFGVIVVYVSQIGDLASAKVFLTTVDWRYVDLELFVSALTQVFFSLSVGMAVLLTYGSYVKSGQPLLITGVIAAMCDLIFAILMVTVIFSIVFAFGLRPDSGIGLIFETLPVAFSQMPNGVFWSSAFFLMILIAAVISGYSLLSPLVSLLRQQFDLSKRLSAWIVGIFMWLLGLLPLFSFSKLQFSFFYFKQERSNGFFDLFNLPLASLWLIISAMMIGFFASQVIRRKDSKALLQIPGRVAYNIWWYTVKYLTPIVCIVALLAIMMS
jgi:NSS family neurotransmitter:Na+ symporter